MSLFVPLKRTTLHIPGTGSIKDPSVGHLHIVLNDPCENKRNLCVSISSFYDKCDQTCLLTSGHKFIRHKSFIFYAKADIVDSQVLMRCVNEGIITYEGLFDEKEFADILAGVPKSPHTPPKCKAYYQKYCL